MRELRSSVVTTYAGSPSGWGRDGFSVWVSLNARFRDGSPPLYWVGVALLAMSIPCLFMVFADARQLHGVSVWLKPLKFQLSTGIYLLSLALFMSWLPASALKTRMARYVVWAAVLSGLFEVAYISWQGANGLASHFNVSTRTYAAMYTLMGVGAVILTSAALVLGILIARTQQYGLAPAVKLAVVIGLIFTFVIGVSSGGYLSAQRAGHWVGGVMSDRAGLPLLQWSRSGGDLRVAHFFGIHAMHFIPAFGALLSFLRVPQIAAVRAVWVFSITFAAFCIWTFLQARNGQAFLS
jgi:hypothetical protein